MRNIYYAWKDGTGAEGAKREWVRLTGREFRGIAERNRALPPEKRRHFCRLPGTERGDACLYLECTYAEYRKSRAEKERAARMRRKMQEKDGDAFRVPFRTDPDPGTYGEPFQFEEAVPDPDSGFEERLAASLDLGRALLSLDPEKRRILEALYLSDDPVSERELARRTGIPQKTLNNRKRAALMSLRRKLAQKD